MRASLGIVFLIEIFFFQYFEYIMPFSPGLQGFAEKFPDRIMVILLHRTNKFSIASFKILFVLYFRYFDYNMSQHHLLWVDCIWGHLIFLVWFSIFPPKIWKIFSQFLFKSMSLFQLSRTSVMWTSVPDIMQDSFFFFFHSIVSSAWTISSDLSFEFTDFLILLD